MAGTGTGTLIEISCECAMQSVDAAASQELFLDLCGDRVRERKLSLWSSSSVVEEEETNIVRTCVAVSNCY